MAVILTAEDYADMAINIATRHASDADKQAFYDAFKADGAAIPALVITRVNLEMGGAPVANLDDAIYKLAQWEDQRTADYNEALLSLGCLANGGVGFGSWALAQAGLTAYAAERVAAEAAAEANAIATADADATAKVAADKAAFLAGVNTLTGGAAASYEAAIADINAHVVSEDGDEFAIAKIAAEFAAAQVATYDPIIDSIVARGAGLAGFAHVANVSVEFGGTIISITPAALKTDFVDNAGAKVAALSQMLTAINNVLIIPNNGIGVTMLQF